MSDAAVTASRITPGSTYTSVPAGASMRSPSTVNVAAPATTMYSSSWATAPALRSSWDSMNGSPGCRPE